MTVEGIKDAITHLSDSERKQLPIGSRIWRMSRGTVKWSGTLPRVVPVRISWPKSMPKLTQEISARPKKVFVTGVILKRSELSLACIAAILASL